MPSSVAAAWPETASSSTARFATTARARTAARRGFAEQMSSTAYFGVA